MFYYLRGQVALVEPGLVVVDCGGVGYALSTSHTSAAAARTGETATFYTYLHVREDIFDLYGFASQAELACFKQLIGVSGVGPKAALAILGVATPEKLALSVLSGDEKALTAAPGVGKKLAQRILLELKDKLAAGAAEGPGAQPAAAQGLLGGGNIDRALAALGVLGYSRAAAQQALRGADPAQNTDELVRMALKNLF